MQTISFKLEPEDNQRLNSICGQLDDNIHQIERQLAVEVGRRGHDFKIIGPEDAIKLAKQVILQLHTLSATDIPSKKDLNLILQSVTNQKSKKGEFLVEKEAITKTQKMQISPRGANQQRYIKRILKNDINFGIGPAGTGKTFLAVAAAVSAFEAMEIKRIVLVRPAVEAGESLGFLPGDLSQKVDPYLRPMYDALYELMGVEKVLRLIEKQIIEIAPLAFMRGRNLNDSFIILDESQNTTREQMKMFLTRLGFNSKAVVTGDITQVDLPTNKKSGLRHVINVLNGIEGISFTFFDHNDVVRHSLVQKVVEAYDKFDNQ